LYVGVENEFSLGETNMARTQSTKTRHEIIDECVNMVAGCWRHYVDTSLTDEKRAEIWAILNFHLPHNFTTAEWDKYAKEYNEYVNSEA
jgi:hypothetical protein